MDRIECRTREEALDRAAWLRAYRAARKRAKRGERVAAGAVDTAGACLAARARANARELERLDYRPRAPRLGGRVDWLGFVGAAA